MLVPGCCNAAHQLVHSLRRVFLTSGSQLTLHRITRVNVELVALQLAVSRFKLESLPLRSDITERTAIVHLDDVDGHPNHRMASVVNRDCRQFGQSVMIAAVFLCCIRYPP